jgi:hypothetical protein
MNTDTPETDVFFSRKDIDWDKEVEFCRKLERERDRLAKACDQYSEDEILCKLHKVTEQRDRLAEALQRVRDGYGGQLASPNCCEDCDFLIPIDAALQSLTPNEL